MNSPSLHTIWISALTFCLGSCVASDDFSVSGELTQRIDVAATDTVVIYCYCPDREIIQSYNGSEIELYIEGTHSSLGYHGDQEKPQVVSPELLQFIERRAGTTVVLESLEYTHIHHAYIVDLLRVRVPTGQEVRFEPILKQALEGRRPLKLEDEAVAR